jgi:ferrous iron transport protein A
LEDICTMTDVKLSEIALGQTRIIKHVTAGFLAAKMADLGLYQGNAVSVIFKAPLGDPLAVSVGGTIVSLRLDEAKWITVEA